MHNRPQGEVAYPGFQRVTEWSSTAPSRFGSMPSFEICGSFPVEIVFTAHQALFSPLPAVITIFRWHAFPE
jgi:hypothetical protein